MNLPDFLTKEEDGLIRVNIPRIGLAELVHHYNQHWSPEMLCCQYPALPLALIHEVIAFYQENRSEVDAYIARTESGRQYGPAPMNLAMVELRRLLEARHLEEMRACTR
jgi:hypothetical protein